VAKELPPTLPTIRPPAVSTVTGPVQSGQSELIGSASRVPAGLVEKAHAPGRSLGARPAEIA